MNKNNNINLSKMYGINNTPRNNSADYTSRDSVQTNNRLQNNTSGNNTQQMEQETMDIMEELDLPSGMREDMSNQEMGNYFNNMQMNSNNLNDNQLARNSAGNLIPPLQRGVIMNSNANQNMNNRGNVNVSGENTTGNLQGENSNMLRSMMPNSMGGAMNINNASNLNPMPRGVTGGGNIFFDGQMMHGQNLMNNPNYMLFGPENVQNLNGFLRTQIGKQVTIQFLLGNDMLVEKTGKIVAIGNNYILISDAETSQNIACNFWDIKFIRFID